MAEGSYGPRGQVPDIRGQIQQYAGPPRYRSSGQQQPQNGNGKQRGNGGDGSYRSRGDRGTDQPDAGNQGGSLPDGVGSHLHIHYHGGDGGWRGLDGRGEGGDGQLGPRFLGPPTPQPAGGPPASQPGPTDFAGMLQQWFQSLAGAGRHGDTMLAHINPDEASMLHDQGGSGTINPTTGLPEFWDPAGGGSNTTGNAGNAGNAGGGNFDSSTQSYDVASGTHGAAGAPGSGNTAPGGSLNSGSGGKGGSNAGSMGSTATGSAGQRGLSGASQGQTGPGATSSGTTGYKGGAQISSADRSSDTPFNRALNAASGSSVTQQSPQPSSPALTSDQVHQMMLASTREMQAAAGYYSPTEASVLGLDARNIAPGYGVTNSYDEASKYPSKYVWRGNRLVPTSMAATENTPAEWDAFTSGLKSRQADYADEGNSFLDNVGNFLLGAGLDIREQKPDPRYTSPNTDADWAFDPVGTVAGMAYRGAGIPASIISGLLGRPLAVSLGPDVFGDTPSAEPSNISKSWDAITGGRDYSLAGGSVPAGYSEDASGKWVANAGGQGTVDRALGAISDAAKGAFAGTQGGAGTAEGAARFGNVGGEGGARGADTGYQNAQQRQQQRVTGPTGTPPAGTPPGATGATGATGGTATQAQWDALPKPGKNDHHWTKAYKGFLKNNDLAGYTAYLQAHGKLPATTPAPGTGATGATGGTVDAGGLHIPAVPADLIAQLLASFHTPANYARPPLPMPSMPATSTAQDAMLAAARQMQGIA